MSDSNNGSGSNGLEVAQSSEVAQPNEAAHSTAVVRTYEAGHMGQGAPMAYAMGDGRAADYETEEQYRSELPVTPLQQKCLDCLAGGSTVTDAARFAGVSRKTVYKWLKNDPVFVAAMNEWKNHLGRCSRTRLEALVFQATTCIERAVNHLNPHTAMQLLKNMGVFKPQVERDTEPADVRRRLEMDQMRLQIRLNRDEHQVLVEAEEAMAKK